MKYLMIPFFMALAGSSAAQKKHPITTIDTQIYTYVKQMPEAGFDLVLFMMNNVKCADSMIEKGTIPGRIVTRFIVYEDGHTGNYEITKSSGVPQFDTEVLNALSRMPPWKPGKQKGKPVKVYYSMPLIVHLDR